MVPLLLSVVGLTIMAMGIRYMVGSPQSLMAVYRADNDGCGIGTIVAFRLPIALRLTAVGYFAVAAIIGVNLSWLSLILLVPVSAFCGWAISMFVVRLPQTLGSGFAVAVVGALLAAGAATR